MGVRNFAILLFNQSFRLFTVEHFIHLLLFTQSSIEISVEVSIEMQAVSEAQLPRVS